MTSMAELMNDVLPQQSAGAQKQTDKERVEWVSFQSCDLTGIYIWLCHNQPTNIQMRIS